MAVITGSRPRFTPDIIREDNWGDTDTRPCGTLLINEHSCLKTVSISPGPVRCSDGHTTMNLAGSRPPKGEKAHRIVACWAAYDVAQDKCIRIVVLRTHAGDLKVFYKASKVIPIVRYGSEPLTERQIVLTNHAKDEAMAEDIKMWDIRAVLYGGEVVQVQPGLVYRVEGVDTSGRPVAVCYRFNTRHEIVVITTFVIQNKS